MVIVSRDLSSSLGLLVLHGKKVLLAYAAVFVRAVWRRIDLEGVHDQWRMRRVVFKEQVVGRTLTCERLMSSRRILGVSCEARCRDSASRNFGGRSKEPHSEHLLRAEPGTCRSCFTTNAT